MLKYATTYNKYTLSTQMHVPMYVLEHIPRQAVHLHAHYTQIFVRTVNKAKNVEYTGIELIGFQCLPNINDRWLIGLRGEARACKLSEY